MLHNASEVLGSLEHDIKPSGSIKAEKFLTS